MTGQARRLRFKSSQIQDILTLRLGHIYNIGIQKGEETMSTYRHDHTHITSQDAEKAVEFYTQIMNAKVIKVQESSGRKMVDIDLGGIPVRISSGTGADDVWRGRCRCPS